MADPLSALAATLISLGAPALGKALAGEQGEAMARSASAILASVLGVAPTPTALAPALEKADPASIRAAEADFSALFLKEAETFAALSIPKDAFSLFRDGWRPALSWLVGLAWLQALILAPWIAAIGWRAPAIALDHLTTLTTIWLSIYGIGHTAKHILAKDRP